MAEESNTQLIELISMQNQLLSEQKQSFSELIALQKEFLANQKRDFDMRRKLFRVVGMLAVLYIALSLASIFLK
jgi:hypothetical protein